MVAKNLSKQGELRNRVYKFFEENKNPGKSFTLKHFTSEKVPRRTINKRQSARKFNISQQRVCQLLQNNGICANKKKRYLVALNSKKL
jgi:hypothetical protein